MAKTKLLYNTASFTDSCLSKHKNVSLQLVKDCPSQNQRCHYRDQTNLVAAREIFLPGVTIYPCFSCTD